MNSENGISSYETNEKSFPYRIYKKDKIMEKAIKIKTIDNNVSYQTIWGIWHQSGDVSGLLQLRWVHGYHPNWLNSYATSCIFNGKVPIWCPIWNKEIQEKEVRALVSRDQYDHYLNLLLNYSLHETDKNWMKCCPKIENKKEHKNNVSLCKACRQTFWMNWKELWNNEHKCKKNKPKTSKRNTCFCADYLWKKWNKDILANMSTKSTKNSSKSSKQPVHSYSAKPVRSKKFTKYVSSCINLSKEILKLK